MCASVRSHKPEHPIGLSELNHPLDMDMALDVMVPESLDWIHTDEGPEYVVNQLDG